MSQRTTRWLFAFLGAVLLLGILGRASVAFYERLRTREAVEIPPRPVSVVVMEPQVFERVVPISGALTPIRSADVFPKVGGRVTRVSVLLGDQVREGQALATVESTEYGLMAEQARKGAQMAGEGAALAERSMDRLETVQKALGEGALSQQDFEKARMEATNAQTQREVVEIQARLAAQMVSNATMTAPFAGRVSKVLATEGSMVGNEYPAFHVDDLSSFVVRCQVGDLDLPSVKPGQEVRLVSDALPGLTLQGRVTAVAAALDAWTRRAPVEIAVPNPDGQVTGNLFAHGEIVTARDEGAFVVPVEAVDRSQEQPTVQVARDGTVSVVPVVVVGESGGRVSLQGLARGDAVILPGADHLAAGEKVQPVQQGG